MVDFWVCAVQPTRCSRSARPRCCPTPVLLRLLPWPGQRAPPPCPLPPLSVPPTHPQWVRIKDITKLHHLLSLRSSLHFSSFTVFFSPFPSSPFTPSPSIHISLLLPLIPLLPCIPFPLLLPLLYSPSPPSRISFPLLPYIFPPLSPNLNPLLVFKPYWVSLLLSLPSSSQGLSVSSVPPSPLRNQSSSFLPVLCFSSAKVSLFSSSFSLFCSGS